MLLQSEWNGIGRLYSVWPTGGTRGILGGKPSCPASGTVTGTIASADIMALPGQGIAAGDFAAVLQAIGQGAVYANVTSSLFPFGEIRGQIHGGKDGGDDDQSE